MTKLVATRIPTIDDAEKLLLREPNPKFALEDGSRGSKLIAISTDGSSLAVMDLEKREVHTSLPIGEQYKVSLIPIVTVTEEVMADPILNPSQEESTTSLLVCFNPEKDDKGQSKESEKDDKKQSERAFIPFKRLAGTDEFVCTVPLATLEPDSMSYRDSNFRTAMDWFEATLKDPQTVIIARTGNEVHNIVKPERVYGFEPGYKVVFGNIERTPENDSYPNIIDDELKPPEHGAVYQEIQPIPEKEFLERFNEKKAAFEERLARQQFEAEQHQTGSEDIGDSEEEIEDENIGIG